MALRQPLALTAVGSAAMVDIGSLPIDELARSEQDDPFPLLKSLPGALPLLRRAVVCLFSERKKWVLSATGPEGPTRGASFGTSGSGGRGGALSTMDSNDGGDHVEGHVRADPSGRGRDGDERLGRAAVDARPRPRPAHHDRGRARPRWDPAVGRGARPVRGAHPLHPAAAVTGRGRTVRVGTAALGGGRP